MKFEFYGRSQHECIIDNSRSIVMSIRDRCFGYHENTKWLLDDLKHKRDNPPIFNIVGIRYIDNGYRLVKTVEEKDIDRDMLEKSNQVEINGRQCDISNIIYDIDNNVAKCYLDDVFFKQSVSEDRKNAVFESAKKEFVREISDLISLLEIRIQSNNNKDGFFKRIFKNC